MNCSAASKTESAFAFGMGDSQYQYKENGAKCYAYPKRSLDKYNSAVIFPKDISYSMNSALNSV